MKDHPTGHEDVVSQDRWSLVTGLVTVARPSLSGHSQQRPPSLIRPIISCLPSGNGFLSIFNSKNSYNSGEMTVSAKNLL